MKKFKLETGAELLIDDIDYDLIKDENWTLTTNIDGVMYLYNKEEESLHDIILKRMGIYNEKYIITFKDGNALNLCRNNLVHKAK